RVQQKVADFEARRGPLEGLKQIANDPDYLAEWQEQSATKSETSPQNVAGDGRTSTSAPPVKDSITVDIVLPGAQVGPLEPAPEILFTDEVEQAPGAIRQSSDVEPAAGLIPIVSKKPAVFKMTESPAIDVISRHAGSAE